MANSSDTKWACRPLPPGWHWEGKYNMCRLCKRTSAITMHSVASIEHVYSPAHHAGTFALLTDQNMHDFETLDEAQTFAEVYWVLKGELV